MNRNKTFLIAFLVMVLPGFLCLTQVSAFGPLTEHGPFFVRARYITVPLRTDLNWNNWNRDLVMDMRYNGKIYYPAIDDVQEEPDGNSIFFPPDTSGAPYPAVIFIQGANTSIEQNAWLMEHVASYGYIVIAVTEFMSSAERREGQFPNLYPPGVTDPSNWLSSMTIPDIVTYLEDINTSVHDPLPPLFTSGSERDVVRNPGFDLDYSMFHSMVDTTKIILSGHSFGGFQALMSACTSITNPPRPGSSPPVGFTNNVVGCFTYGAHTFAASGNGYPSSINVPLLFLGGEKDGVGSGPITGNPNASGYERMKFTFENFIPASTDNSRYMIIIKDANHLSYAAKPDPTVDRSFLDGKDGIISRFIAHRIIKEKVTAFLQFYVKGDASSLAYLTGADTEPFIFDFAVK